ncbi:MAG: N-methyl-L-tryptophan oxidase [Phycisphaerae bacterium]|nr:N-methyl-L-tryptophan oxidase [Phycisphaerae bacterium]
MELSAAEDHFDFIVLGCGAMGAAACMHLARQSAARGARVLGIEQFRCGHARGSSHGHSRVIRQAYFEHPDYVPLLRRSYELFRALERDSGESLLVPCGALFGGRADSEVVRGSELAARSYDIPHEMLDASRLRRRFPQFALPDDHVALWEPGAGFVRPEATTRAHIRLAVAAGARILEDACVIAWHSTDSGFRVETSRGAFSCARLVVTAGAWTSSLVRSVAAHLRVTRQPVAWFECEDVDRAAHSSPQLPIWLVDQHDGTSVYGIPPHPTLDGPSGMKVALHGKGTVSNPTTVERGPIAEEIALIRDAVTRVLPRAARSVSGSSTCMYTNSPDGHFIIDVDATTGAIVACGFSGHGFKFAPVVGEAIADLAIAGATSLPIGFLASSRLGLTGPSASLA